MQYSLDYSIKDDVFSVLCDEGGEVVFGGALSSYEDDVDFLDALAEYDVADGMLEDYFRARERFSHEEIVRFLGDSGGCGVEDMESGTYYASYRAFGEAYAPEMSDLVRAHFDYASFGEELSSDYLEIEADRGGFYLFNH